MNKKILIIVDLQNDFVPGGALGVEGGDQIVPLINKLQEKFDHVVASKDWHPEDHVSFAKTHGKHPGDVILIDGIEQILWPVHCVQNTWGSAFVSSLDEHKIEKVFLKGSDKKIDSYSAVFDNAMLRSTGLEEYLRENQFKDVYIAGLTTEYCIKYTAFDILELGFSPHVIIDACRGIELKPGNIAKAIEEMKQAGIKVIDSKELL